MSKDRLDYFPFYPDAFVCDGNVEVMNTTGVGAYMLLLCKAWRENPVGSLPDDDVKLAAWSRVSLVSWQELKQTVMAAFTLGTDGRWHQKRLRQEYEAVKKLIKSRSEAGLKGNKVRWQKDRNAIAEPSHARLSLSLSSGLPLERSDKEKPAAKSTDDVDNQVSDLYAMYPRKRARPQALKAIRSALKKSKFEVIKTGLRKYCEEVRGKDPHYIAHPATWFNSERWLDDPDETPASQEYRDDLPPPKGFDDLTPEQQKDWEPDADDGPIANPP